MLRKKKSEAVVVNTKEELKAAVNRKFPCIEVRGSLAKKLKWMGSLSPAKITALAALLTAAAIPNPASALSSAAAVAAVGKGTVAAIVSCGLSAALILAVLKGYNVEFDYGKGVVRLTAK